jgi:tRNA(fMet)-specific endonuclease VapC
MGLILDTNFVVDAEREAARRKPGRAARFLQDHGEEQFFLTFTVAGELACGQSATPEEVWRKLLRPYAILGWDLEVSRQYGEIYRELAAVGSLIGTNDLWIAATARRHSLGIVTNNLAEFSRVAGLEVKPY